MGCAMIHLRHHQAIEYMAIMTSKSNKEFHALWFCVKNDAVARCRSSRQSNRGGTQGLGVGTRREGEEEDP